MPCFHPLHAWRGRKPGKSGKVPIVFESKDSCGVKVELPCGQCIGCRLEKSRQWAVRAMHEASLHENNSFVTLTYDPAHLPGDGSVSVRHWQLFAKKLRKAYGPFRFLQCAEYGEELGRPHYHACLFGVGFEDLRLYSSRDGVRLYESDTLTRVWGQGIAMVGDVTFESAAYVARYVTKKVTGESAESHYMSLDERTGELKPISPEFGLMSRRPGLGKKWLEQWGNEVYPSDEVYCRGYLAKPPRYYDSLYDAVDPSGMDAVRKQRRKDVREHAANCTPERLRVREVCAEARKRLLKRALESGTSTE